MNEQLDLLSWVDKPSNVIDAVPALIRKAALETIYSIPRPTGGKVIELRRKVA